MCTNLLSFTWQGTYLDTLAIVRSLTYSLFSALPESKPAWDIPLLLRSLHLQPSVRFVHTDLNVRKRLDLVNKQRFNDKCTILWGQNVPPWFIPLLIFGCGLKLKGN
jgi:hypothetical protein